MRPNVPARVEAMKRSWRHEDERFHCYYTGVALDTSNPKSPRYFAFDHRTPRMENDIVVASQLINDMKSDLTEPEFKRLVVELANRFQGGEFDERALEVVHFKRGG